MRANQRGFSLIELLIVLGLMATAAALALSTAGSQNNQNRFNETLGKLEHLREAIAGKTMTINGQTVINGFVADMGRLPNNIEELLTAPPDCNPDIDTDEDGDFTNDDDPCVWTYDEINEIWHGWHGPYVFGVNTAYRDGWGKEWEWELIPSLPLTPIALIISSYGLDTDQDVDTNTITGIERPYGDSTIQQKILAGFTARLPFSPLKLKVSKAPYCGQCRAIEYNGTGVTAITACDNAANHEWNDRVDPGYCVETSATTVSAESCEAISTEATTWVPLFSGVCDNPLYVDKTLCESSSAIWTPLDSTADCNDPLLYPTPNYDFTDGNTDICMRVIHINHGQLVINTHNSTNATAADIIAIGQSATFGDDFPFQPNMEDKYGNADLTLPHGAMRVGLYQYKLNINGTLACSTDPYPSESAQAISDVFTLRSDAPPTIGTSTSPIDLYWRSEWRSQ